MTQNITKCETWQGNKSQPVIEIITIPADREIQIYVGGYYLTSCDIDLISKEALNELI